MRISIIFVNRTAPFSRRTNISSRASRSKSLRWLNQLIWWVWSSYWPGSSNLPFYCIRLEMLSQMKIFLRCAVHFFVPLWWNTFGKFCNLFMCNAWNISKTIQKFGFHCQYVQKIACSMTFLLDINLVVQHILDLGESGCSWPFFGEQNNQVALSNLVISPILSIYSI